MALTIEQKLNILKTQAQAIISPLLIAALLDDFDSYLDEPPNNSEEKQLAIYLDQTLTDEPKSNFNILIQAQLYNISPKVSYKYQQIIHDFIKDFDPSLIEEVSRGQILGDNWPVDENSSTIILFTVRFETDIDDCNY